MTALRYEFYRISEVFFRLDKVSFMLYLNFWKTVHLEAIFRIKTSLLCYCLLKLGASEGILA